MKLKKKRRDSELKLGYGNIYDYGNNQKIKPSKSKQADIIASEDKEWEDLHPLEIRQMMLKGWKTKTFLTHYGVTIESFYNKIRRGWILS